ncbi:MAG: hypothetical protein WAU77_11040 [Solirubrobacteraceae bacterium]
MTDLKEASGAPVFDPIYVEARRVLLDALTALAPQGAAVIVAGAQAVYLRTGEADIAVAPYTTDGDLTLDPSLLMDEPALETVMRGAGFDLEKVDGHAEPGRWVAPANVAGQHVLIPVDLIVPEAAASGGGTRGARLGAHGKRAARRAVGLEAVLLDHDPMNVAALDTTDTRSVEVEVAGPAALLVAKVHKLHDRVAGEKAKRINDKDAADVFRLMQKTNPDVVGGTLASLAKDEVAGPVTVEAICYIEELFGRRGRPGIAMAAQALRIGVPEAQVETLAVSYTERLLSSALS